MIMQFLTFVVFLPEPMGYANGHHRIDEVKEYGGCLKMNDIMYCSIVSTFSKTRAVFDFII